MIRWTRLHSKSLRARRLAGRRVRASVLDLEQRVDRIMRRQPEHLRGGDDSWPKDCTTRTAIARLSALHAGHAVLAEVPGKHIHDICNKHDRKADTAAITGVRWRFNACFGGCSSICDPRTEKAVRSSTEARNVRRF